MKVFIFKSEMLCESCGNAARRDFEKPAHVNEADESSYDSGDWPKGPYGNGGGEADSPQHCACCGMFLENPLTPDGDSYVRELCKPYEYPDDDGDVAPWHVVAQRAADDGEIVLAEWIRYYFAPGM